MEQLCYPEMPMFSLFGYGRKTSQYNSNFTHHWLRLNRARTNWKAILRPCKDQQSWVTVRQGWTNDKRSSASESFISHMDIQRSGHFSRIFIQSQTAKGKPKTFGGDSWRVYITGPANIAAHVFDHENGTYEAIALIMEAGKYTVHAYLDYSLCDGLRDPPKNWFNLGNFHGRNQPEGSIGFLDHFLYEKMKPSKFHTFEVRPARKRLQGRAGEDLSTSIAPIKCEHSCRCLASGLGRWLSNEWVPFVQGCCDREQDMKRKSLILKFDREVKSRKMNFNTQSSSSEVTKGSLWIYGDSLAVRFYNSVATTTLCQTLFRSCGYSYNWVYPIPNENEAVAKKLNDDFDFRPELVLESIRNVLRRDDMKTDESILILNFVLHYTMSLNFTTYQRLVDDVIVMLRNRWRDLGSNARIIWKTSTAIKKENEPIPRNLTFKRFFTDPRVRLFDTYAMSAMCKAGFEVLDVFKLTDSYLPGPTDVVHYHPFVFKTVQKELEIYAQTRKRYQPTEICVQ
ncbi:uncharacterized protein LOC124452500 [Xenia sp. Carnegie-2017]|uniref:uncharacterized protein LOC124452500 n=1 Tax=Xenia sp. Carnegie-2017 TaxID=2897299 RepID=UPI001F03FA43|nr:uncharacterized protein LOC124452500 [Xenia sp. Carnegie-2017]